MKTEIIVSLIGLGIVLLYGIVVHVILYRKTPNLVDGYSRDVRKFNEDIRKNIKIEIKKDEDFGGSVLGFMYFENFEERTAVRRAYTRLVEICKEDNLMIVESDCKLIFLKRDNGDKKVD